MRQIIVFIILSIVFAGCSLSNYSGKARYSYIKKVAVDDPDPITEAPTTLKTIKKDSLHKSIETYNVNSEKSAYQQLDKTNKSTKISKKIDASKLINSEQVLNKLNFKNVAKKREVANFAKKEINVVAILLVAIAVILILGLLAYLIPILLNLFMSLIIVSIVIVAIIYLAGSFAA